MIKIENLSFQIDNKKIISNISFNINEGEFLGIIGPNGSGKTTLLKNIYNNLKGTGKVLYIDKEISKYKNKELAKEIAIVSQQSKVINYSVEDIVRSGRYPYTTLLKGYTSTDEKIVQETMKRLDITSLKDNLFDNLSGGEQQRVMIARAIAQEAKVIILDEPTNHLDIKFQLEIMSLLKGLNLTIISTIHDMNLASIFCDRLIALNEGQVHSIGNVENVLTKEFFLDVFKVNADIQRRKNSNTLQIYYNPY